MNQTLPSQTPRPARRGLLVALLVVASCAAACRPAAAQLLGNTTVRDNEFRSRWADYQVDRPQNPAATTAATAADTTQPPAGLLAAFGRSINDIFRNGPLQVGANLAAGWEFSNEANLRIYDPSGSNNSPLLAPAIGVFYNREFGPATLSLRYSAGYVYYLDQSYIAANHNGGILSQTLGADFALEGKRTSWTSSTTASYGNGNDIQSGVQRDLLSAGETLRGSYVVSEFSQLVVSATVGYSGYAGGTSNTSLGVADTDTLSDTFSLYYEYTFSPKTRARFEVDAGQEHQHADSTTFPQLNPDGTVSLVTTPATDADRSFYQALFQVNYSPFAKVNLDAGLGYGVQDNDSVQGRGHSGSHPIFRLGVNYAPTEKTTASLHFGYEGVDVEPDFGLQVNWQFRPTTAASISAYQQSGFSTYQVAQSLVTRGVLVSAQQRFFQKVDVTVSGGVEQSVGYDGAAVNEDPYYFGGASFLYQINSYLALQGYYRGYTGQGGTVRNYDGLQSRGAISLRLTF